MKSDETKFIFYYNGIISPSVIKVIHSLLDGLKSLMDSRVVKNLSLEVFSNGNDVGFQKCCEGLVSIERIDNGVLVCVSRRVERRNLIKIEDFCDQLTAIKNVDFSELIKNIRHDKYDPLSNCFLSLIRIWRMTAGKIRQTHFEEPSGQFRICFSLAFKHSDTGYYLDNFLDRVSGLQEDVFMEIPSFLMVKRPFDVIRLVSENFSTKTADSLWKSYLLDGVKPTTIKINHLGNKRSLSY